MSVNLVQPSEKQLSVAVIQPIDKIIINLCQLMCFPSFLQFITPYVTVHQNVDFNESCSIKIYDVDYMVFLKFLHQCCTIIQNKESANNIDLKVSLDQTEIKLTYGTNDDNFLFTISNEICKYTFDSRTIPNLFSAVSKLIFKTLGYSHNINYVVDTFVQLAPASLLIKPTYKACFAIFENIEAIQIDYFLLFDIINRHKSILLYVKRLQQLQDE